MTTDAVWNGGIGTLAYTWRGGKEKEKCVGWRNAPQENRKGDATDKGKVPLSCRRDGSPATVIVMRAWLAVVGVSPAAFV